MEPLIARTPGWGSSGFTHVNGGYLAPYLDELAIYRQTPELEQFIHLLVAKLVDILPTWLEDAVDLRGNACKHYKAMHLLAVAYADEVQEE